MHLTNNRYNALTVHSPITLRRREIKSHRQSLVQSSSVSSFNNCPRVRSQNKQRHRRRFRFFTHVSLQSIHRCFLLYFLISFRVPVSRLYALYICVCVCVFKWSTAIKVPNTKYFQRMTINVIRGDFLPHTDLKRNTIFFEKFWRALLNTLTHDYVPIYYIRLVFDPSISPIKFRVRT